MTDDIMNAFKNAYDTSLGGQASSMIPGIGDIASMGINAAMPTNPLSMMSNATSMIPLLGMLTEGPKENGNTVIDDLIMQEELMKALSAGAMIPGLGQIPASIQAILNMQK